MLFFRFYRMRKISFFLLLGFAWVSQVAAQEKTPYIILVSFDGFRFDYVQKFDPPNFKTFIRKGARAEALIPSFPSKTFPNHYTIVTGLYPAHHGIVDNRFYDSEKNEMYDMHDKEQVADPGFYAGTPIWQLARQQGVKSASYFWVGSEMNDPARRPDYYFPFDDSQRPEDRMDQALTWLRLPPGDRPHFISLYFSSPDHEGHDFGPSSDENKRAVLKADSLLGRLMSGLAELNLPVNVIVVSDHGMAELKTTGDTFIFLSDILGSKSSDIKMAVTGTLVHLYVRDQNKKDSVYRKLKSMEKHFTVYQKKDLPGRWHYRSNRVGDIVISAHPGHYIREGDRKKFFETARLQKKFGVHGFDPAEEPDMRGIFYAQGPNIKPGITIPEFENIHIFPLMIRILGLTLPPVDGNMKVLDKIYRK